MRHANDEFPTVERLRRGCILAGIADAVSGVEPSLAFPRHSWHGPTYVVDTEQAEEGAIAFDNVVSGFLFSKYSSRNPGSSRPYDPNWYLGGMPPAARVLGEAHAFPHLSHRDFGSGLVPYFTAVFWSEGDRLAAAEPWAKVMEHSGDLLEIQLMDADEALPALTNQVNLTEQQPAAVRSLWERRVVSRDAVVVVEPWERAQLAKIGIILP